MTFSITALGLQILHKNRKKVELSIEMQHIMVSVIMLNVVAPLICVERMVIFCRVLRWLPKTRKRPTLAFKKASYEVLKIILMTSVP
jgi:hypothetical protein